MKIKRFNEIQSEEILLFNNEGDLKLGIFRLSQQGKSGAYYIKNIDDVDWKSSKITFLSYKRGSTEWINISQESLDKFTNELKLLLYEAQKRDEDVKCSFYIDDNGKAKLIHIGLEFLRVEKGGKITSYISKFEY